MASSVLARASRIVPDERRCWADDLPKADTVDGWVLRDEIARIVYGWEHVGVGEMWLWGLTMCMAMIEALETFWA